MTKNGINGDSPSGKENKQNQILKAKTEWEESVDSIDDVMILANLENKILRCNKMLCSLTGKNYTELLGEKWDDIFSGSGFKIETKGQEHVEISHQSGNWFHLNTRTVTNKKNVVYGNVIYLHNVTKLKNARKEIEITKNNLEKKNLELENAYTDLKKAQSQILQQEKMASIGQLAAGIAHEINNPVGFIMSNLNSLQKYMNKIVEFLKVQSLAISDLASPSKKDIDSIMNNVSQKQKSLDLDYILGDIENLIKESLDGTNRVKVIVQDLKSFARVDESEHKVANINTGLNSTINIVWNEIKYKATLKKEFGDNIPMIKCNPGQLNQVFMNILVNASQAIEKQGEITVKTWHDNGHIYVSISDNGSGIPEKTLNNIFDPFFTTKEVGSGTGLGLSIAYDIIKKHNGELKVESKVGQGTTFTIEIPIVAE